MVKNIGCVEIMCKYNGVGSREGIIVTAIKSGSTDENIIQSIKDSRGIGKIIAGSVRKAQYLSVINSAMEDVIKKWVENDKLNEGYVDLREARIEIRTNSKLSARFQPGLIFDFPVFDIICKNKIFSTRTCLTVCARKSKSKIWSRVHVYNKDDEAEILTATDLASFHKFSAIINERLNDNIKALYAEDFSSYYQSSVRLHEIGRISIFIADTIDSDMSLETEGNYSNMVWNEAAANQICGTELAQAITDVSQISIPNCQFGIDDEQNCLIGSDKVSFIPFKYSSGGKSILVSHTDKQKTYIAGVYAGKVLYSDSDTTHNDLIETYDGNIETPHRVSPSGEIATFIGSAF